MTRDGKQGKVKDVKIKLEVEEDHTRKFYKARPLPFAIKDKIVNEIERMVKNKVLEKVEYSDYATPIVPVKKPSGDLEFVVTTN